MAKASHEFLKLVTRLEVANQNDLFQHSYAPQNLFMT